MSDKKNENETPVFSPDSASEALRKAFLELSNSAWDIEKEIGGVSSEIFETSTTNFGINDDSQNQKTETENQERESLGDIGKTDNSSAKTDSDLNDIIEESLPKEKKDRFAFVKNFGAKLKDGVSKKLEEIKDSQAEKVESKKESDEKKIEEQKLAEEKKIEAAKKAEEKRLEKARLAEEKRLEKAKLAEEKRLEKERLAEEKRMEAERLAEEKRLEEERIAEEKRLAQVAELAKEQEVDASEENQSYKSDDELTDNDLDDQAEEFDDDSEEFDEDQDDDDYSSYDDPDDFDDDYDEEENLSTENQPEENHEEKNLELSPELVVVENPKKEIQAKKEKNGPNYFERIFEAEDKSQKESTGLWRTIMLRELQSYFTSPVAYIVTALFLAFSGVLFFSTFFLANRAELRGFFESLPMLFSFFIPALTMRLFSEERKSGSLETLVTLPVTSLDIVLGKYFASLISSLVMLLPTVFYVIACNIFGHPDAGPIWGGYIGAVFLAASFCAIGLFSSSITKNQILAFFVAFAICISLTFVSSFVVLLPPFLSNLFMFISTTTHFDYISRGILDSRDLIYFVSITLFFVVLTVRCLNKSRRG